MSETTASALVNNASAKNVTKSDRPRSRLEDEMSSLLAVLNNNALAAALFLTMEVPLLIDPAQEIDDDGEINFSSWRMYSQLTFATVAVVLHGICVFTACEATFVINHVTHAFDDAEHRDEEFKRFRKTFVGKRVEPISGYTYIWGIVAGMVALASRFGASGEFGSPAGDIVGAVMAISFFAVGLFAAVGVGGYVGGVHTRAAQKARERVSLHTAERDHRGRRLKRDDADGAGRPEAQANSLAGFAVV